MTQFEQEARVSENTQEQCLNLYRQLSKSVQLTRCTNGVPTAVLTHQSINQDVNDQKSQSYREMNNVVRSTDCMPLIERHPFNIQWYTCEQILLHCIMHYLFKNTRLVSFTNPVNTCISHQEQHS